MGDTEAHGAVFLLASSFPVCSWLRKHAVTDEIEICLSCTPGFMVKARILVDYQVFLFGIQFRHRAHVSL